MSPCQQYYGERDYLTVDGRKNQPMCKPLSKHGRGMATKGPFRTAGRLQQQSRKKIKQCGLDHTDRHSTCPVLLKQHGKQGGWQISAPTKRPCGRIGHVPAPREPAAKRPEKNLVVFLDSSPWRKNCAPLPLNAPKNLT